MGPIGFTAVLAAVARGWPATMLGRDRAGHVSRAARRATWAGSICRWIDADVAPADIERDGFDLLIECTGSDDVLVRAAQRWCGRAA